LAAFFADPPRRVAVPGLDAAPKDVDRRSVGRLVFAVGPTLARSLESVFSRDPSAPGSRIGVAEGGKHGGKDDITSSELRQLYRVFLRMEAEGREREFRDRVRFLYAVDPETRRVVDRTPRRGPEGDAAGRFGLPRLGGEAPEVLALRGSVWVEDGPPWGPLRDVVPGGGADPGPVAAALRGAGGETVSWDPEALRRYVPSATDAPKGPKPGEKIDTFFTQTALSGVGASHAYATGAQWAGPTVPWEDGSGARKEGPAGLGLQSLERSPDGGGTWSLSADPPKGSAAAIMFPELRAGCALEGVAVVRGFEPFTGPKLMDCAGPERDRYAACDEAEDPWPAPDEEAVRQLREGGPEMWSARCRWACPRAS
jgi:hypothetical protein